MQTQINKRIASLLADSKANADKLLIGYEKQIITNYRDVLKELKFQISSMYEKYGSNMTFADANRYNRLISLESQISEQIKTITGKNVRLTKQSIKGTFTESYYRTAYAYESGLESRLGFTSLNPAVIDASVINPLDHITWIDRSKAWGATLTNEIKGTITQGLIKGDGYAKVAHDLTDRVNISVNRSLRIVRTEAGRAQSLANNISTDEALASAERLGIKLAKVWHTVKDNRTHPDHLEMDGQEADENGYYTFPDGTKTKAPRLSGLAEQDINCRCTEITKLISLPNSYNPSYKTGNFETWYATKIK